MIYAVQQLTNLLLEFDLYEINSYLAMQEIPMFPYLHEPDTCPEPVESNPYRPILFVYVHFNIIVPYTLRPS
jgi:hypothetical protein